MISSLGVGYIVFHNDTGQKLDKENLQRLLESNELSTVYAKNDWYLFEILGSQTGGPYLVDSLALVDVVPRIYPITSPSLGVVALNENNTKAEFGDGLVKLIISNNTIKSSLEDILANSSLGKQGGNIQDPVVPLMTKWNTVNDQLAESKPIPVSSGDRYLLKVDPASNTTLDFNFQVLGYNPFKGSWQKV